MPIEITMPKLSDTMEQGTILRWLKHEGDSVARGEPLAEVETDKADMELEASDAGTLQEIRIKEGEAAAVGTVIAVLGPAGAAASSRPRAAPEPARPAESARGARDADTPAAASAGTEQTEPAPGPKTSAARPVAAAPRGGRPSPVRAVPPARGAAVPPSPRAASPIPAPTAPGTTERETQSKLRLTVAKQMASSKREVPHFYVTAEIDMSEAAHVREALTRSGTIAEHVTYTHLILRALALTLVRHPRVNASWAEDAVVHHGDVNIAIAVAVDDGLVAPVLRRCQQLSLRAIARAATELVNKAQANRFAGDELTGATFTLSNMGMLDIEEFSAVITRPQSAILAVGAIKDRPVVRDGRLAVAKTMRVTLSVDHRVLNGVEAGRFLEDLKATLENPLSLLLGE